MASPAIGVPVAAGADERHFKMLLLDIGLACSALGVSLAALERVADLALANAGAVAEQVAGQLLRLTFAANEDPALFYWHREQTAAQAEVDYLIQHGPSVVPVEVKAGAGGALRSLHLLMAARGWDRAVRLHGGLASVTRVEATSRLGDRAAYDLLSLPLYMTEHVPRLLAGR
jgi:hypothetical protein